MTLTGTYTRTLDEKHRLAIPKRLRDQFAEPDIRNLFIAPETDRSLAIYSPAAFQQLAQRLAERTSNRAEIRNFLRLFYARAESLEIDSQGRIRIPDRLVEFAHLRHNVVLLGVHDHVEIWDEKLWDEFLASHQADYDNMSFHAFD